MAYNIITLPVTIFFIACGCGQLFYAIILQKKFSKEHNFHNSVFAFFLWITAGLLFPFYYSTDNANIRWFQAVSTFFICVFTPLMLFLILFYQYKKVKKNPEIRERRNIKVFLKEYDERHKGLERSISTDLHRKLLHLFPATLIIVLWVFSVYVWAGMWNADKVWGISGEDYGIFLILTAGFGGILVFAALDFVRLSYIFEDRNIHHLLPDNVTDLLGNAMKRREIFEFTKPALLVLAMAPVFFFPFGVFAAAALIATIGDGAASIIGMKYGKHHFPKNSSKTLEGYISGFLASFGIAVLCLWIFEPQLVLIKIAVIAIAGATIFLITDLLSLEVDDNMINPIFCGIVMTFLYFLL